jgi:hypothetical protein
LSGSFGVHGEGELDEIWDFLKILGDIVQMLPPFVLFSDLGIFRVMTT